MSCSSTTVDAGASAASAPPAAASKSKAKQMHRQVETNGENNIGAYLTVSGYLVKRTESAQKQPTSRRTASWRAPEPFAAILNDHASV
jgi:hypothetical protein